MQVTRFEVILRVIVIFNQAAQSQNHELDTSNLKK